MPPDTSPALKGYVSILPGKSEPLDDSFTGHLQRLRIGVLINVLHVDSKFTLQREQYLRKQLHP